MVSTGRCTRMVITLIFVLKAVHYSLKPVPNYKKNIIFNSPFVTQLIQKKHHCFAFVLEKNAYNISNVGSNNKVAETGQNRGFSHLLAETSQPVVPECLNIDVMACVGSKHKDEVGS